MLIWFLGKTLLSFTAIALIAYALMPGATLGLLAKFMALDIGGALLLLIAYPYARGVRKGDKVFVMDQRVPIVVFGFSNGTALGNGRVGSAIKVELVDGSIAVGTITKYEGLFSNPEAKLLERTVPIEIRK